MMKKYLLLALFAGASLTRAEVISCSSLTTFNDLINAGACSAGIFTIKNATFSSSADISASEFLFNVNTSSGIASMNITGAPFQTAQFGSTFYQFNFTFDPPPDIIKGVSGSVEDADQSFLDALRQSGLFPAAALGNAVDIQYLMCAGAAFVDGGCDADPYGFTLELPDGSGGILPTAILTNSVLFASPTNTVGMQITVTLSNGGVISGLDTGFPLDPVSDVPEPGTLAMAGAGLALAAWRHARRG